MDFFLNASMAGLGTYSIGAPFAGPYLIEGTLSLPQLNQGASAPSEVVVVVNQNGSPVYTGVAGAEGFKANMLCAVGDTIDVVFSSSADVDQGKNVVKSVISISQGV